MNTLNIAKNEGEVTFTPLNETSDKVMMDALVIFKPDDYCPVFDDDFEPAKRSPFMGEISTRPSGVNEIYVCENLFRDELDEKLYEMGYGRGDEEPNWLAEKTATMEVLDDVGYEFNPIFGLPTGKTLDNGNPEIRYSLSQSEGAKVYGFTLTEQTASKDYAKMFVDRENGKDIAFHAMKIYPKDSIPSHSPFLPTSNEEIRDNQIFGFLDEKGIFVPESELNHEFDIASMIDLKEQIKAGKDFEHLPEIVKSSHSLCMSIVAHNPSDLSKAPSMKQEHRRQAFLHGVVKNMNVRSPHGENLKEDSLRLLQELEKIQPNLMPETAAMLIRYNCMNINDLPDNLHSNPSVYAEIVKDNAKLLNLGEYGGVKLSDIPKDMLLDTKVVNAIADQFGAQKDTVNIQKIVSFENLPRELQEHPVILGREAAQNMPMLSVLSSELKNNPEFLVSFFKPLRKEHFPEMFDRLYGGVRNAPFVAKTSAIATVHLKQEDARAILDTTFGKGRTQLMIADAQKAEFGKEKGFAPNFTDEGYRHLLSADVTMNATGEVEAVKFNFDNGYVEPDGDHNGWQSVRSQTITPYNYFEGHIVGIMAPMIGHEQAKKDIGMALGGEKVKTMWIPMEKTEATKDIQRDKSMMMRDDGKSMRG